MSDVELERMVVRLLGDGKDYTRMLQDAQRDTREAQQEISRYTKLIEGSQAALRAAGSAARTFGTVLTAAVTVPVVGAGLGFIKMASDAAEGKSKFDVVFDGVAQGAEEMVNELDKNYGLAGSQARRLLTDTGDLLSGFGFTKEEALNLSSEVQKLAVDLASFTNVEGGAERASAALTAGLLGEREQMKALGIAINENQPEFKELYKHIKATTGAADTQAKALATLQLAQRQSKNAIGDYARTQDGFANQLREVQGDLQDLAVEIGTILLPVGQRLLSFVRQGIDWFRELSTETKTWTVIVAGAVAAVGPLLLAFGVLAPMLATVVGVVGSLAGPILAATVALAGLVAGAMQLSGIDLSGWIERVQGFIANFQENMTILYEWVMGYWESFLETAGAFFGQFSGLWTSVSDSASNAFETIGGYVQDFFANAIGFFVNFQSNIRSILDWLGKNWFNILKDIFNAWVTYHVNMIQNLGVILKMGYRLFIAFEGWVYGLFQRFWNSKWPTLIVEALNKALMKFKEWATKAWDYLVAVFEGDTGKINMDSLLTQVKEDLDKGAKELNFVKTAADIIREEGKNLKSPLDGFKSSIEDLPALNLKVEGVDLPEFVWEKGNVAGKEMGKGVADGLKNQLGKAGEGIKGALGLNQIGKDLQANARVLTDSDEFLQLLGRERFGRGVSQRNQNVALRRQEEQQALLARRGLNHADRAIAAGGDGGESKQVAEQKITNTWLAELVKQQRVASARLELKGANL